MRRTPAIVAFVLSPIIAPPALAGLDRSDAKASSGDSPAAIITSQPEVRDARAQRDLGLRYLNGDGVAKNDVAAFMWIRRAAEQGRGVAQDHNEAVKWFRKAAEQGDASAQYNLGVAYARGDGVEKNEAEALKWIRTAAKEGDLSARNTLQQLEQGKR